MIFKNNRRTLSEGGMYRTDRRDQKRSNHLVVISLVAGFALTGWLWFLFASKFFDITSVDAGTITTLDRGEVVTEVDKAIDEMPWRPWHKTNILMLDANRLSKQLRDRLFVDDVAVYKSYPNVLRLKIKERQRNVVLVSNGQYVTVDASGLVTGDAEGDVLKSAQDRIAARAFADDSLLPVVVMPTADPLSAGFQVGQPEQVRRWLDVTRALVLAGLRIRFMKVESPESALARFVSERGYDIYFDLSSPIDKQIVTYQDYMKTKPDQSQIHEYLDVRVSGKVFIK
jgi:hypothetical protein